MISVTGLTIRQLIETLEQYDPDSRIVVEEFTTNGLAHYDLAISGNERIFTSTGTSPAVLFEVRRIETPQQGMVAAQVPGR